MGAFFGKKTKKKVIGQLRRSQLITTFGSGAIVDMPEYSVIMAGTNLWDEKSPILHEANLERLLGVKYFKQPYVGFGDGMLPTSDVPAFRFPYWHFCPSCHRLMPFDCFGDPNNKTCSNPKCNKKGIVPSRFIAACVNGHMEDFPYSWWVHGGNNNICKDYYAYNKLAITFSDKTGGLESVIITCTTCGRSRSMAGALSRGALAGYKCRGCRPWLGMKKKHYDEKKCEAEMHGLMRGASNVYFPQTANALTIPPWSSNLHQATEDKWNEITSGLGGATDEKTMEIVARTALSSLINEGSYSLKDVIMSIKERLWLSNEQDYTKQRLYEDEYQVFCRRNYEKLDDYQFHIKSTEVAESLQEYISDVILVKRLREVVALKGFRRISPDNPKNIKSNAYHHEDDFIPLSNQPLSWYPGIELLGEGIFIRLNEETLQKWETNRARNYATMSKRLDESNIECPNFSPRYVLLHTFAHLLIRQLSVDCGYSAAAIKERIYSTYPGDSRKMAGILIYTASTDSDGSLGGLVRNGLKNNFETIVYNMLQEAAWCSSDPICIDSKAQGYDSLNFAACHACTLLPETSCEMRNCLLDRAAVVGTIEERDVGFLGELLTFED